MNRGREGWRLGGRDWGEEASFYGALNSDEVARSIPEDPNYPGTDKQTAGGRGEEGRGRKGKTGTSTFLKRL